MSSSSSSLPSPFSLIPNLPKLPKLIPPNNNNKLTNDNTTTNNTTDNNNDNDNSKQQKQQQQDNATTTSTTAEEFGTIPDISTTTDHSKLIQYGLMGIGAFVLIQTILQFFTIIILLLGPILYVYLVQTCPSKDSFDAKKELKRVLRGHYLPDDHIEKPKSYLEQMTAKVTASVTTTVLTSIPGGYQHSMKHYYNAVWISTISVPQSNPVTCYYWIGAVGSWKFVYQQDLTKTTTTKTKTTTTSSKKKD